MLPSVEQLPSWLVERLAATVPTTGGDFHFNSQRTAAVLIPIVLHPTGATVLLTERAAHLSSHGGQVSFPGGASEASDVDAIATALRETEEEIGLPAAKIQVLACLGEYHTISGFCVTPVVGLIQPGFVLRPDPTEVADVFELPLGILLDRSRYEKRWITRQGLRGATHFLEFDERVVWGATAGMLLNFSLDLLLEGIPQDKTQ